MDQNRITYPQKDRWSYLWLVIGTLVMFLWRMPLVWWLAPVFMLRFTRTQKVRRGFLLMWFSTFLTAIPPMYTILNAMMPMPLPIFLVVTAIYALMVWGIPYLVDRRLAPRLKGFSVTLVFPLIVTMMDYISAKANPMGSVGRIAYFQYSNLALMQLLSITGMWGIVFLVNWLGPVVNYAWERGFEWRAIRRNTLVYLVVMLAVLLVGGTRLVYAPEASSTVRVHGFTAMDVRNEMLPKLREAKQQDWETYRQASLEIQELYLEGTIREAHAGAQIVHWPEMAVTLPAEDEDNFITRTQQIVKDESIYVVMSYSVNFEDGSRSEIKLLIIDPAGEVVLEHQKFGGALLDGVKPGDGVLRTVETPFGTLSGIICNDTNHEEVITQAGKNGTDILFSPSMEWKAITPLHAHMATFRAIENGVTLVRQADNGLSFAVDPYGRVSATMDHFNNPERVMVATVPVQSTFTIYPYIGDLFAWLAIVCLAVLTVIGIMQKRRDQQSVDMPPKE